MDLSNTANSQRRGKTKTRSTKVSDMLTKTKQRKHKLSPEYLDLYTTLKGIPDGTKRLKDVLSTLQTVVGLTVHAIDYYDGSEEAKSLTTSKLEAVKELNAHGDTIVATMNECDRLCELITANLRNIRRTDKLAEFMFSEVITAVCDLQANFNTIERASKDIFPKYIDGIRSINPGAVNLVNAVVGMLDKPETEKPLNEDTPVDLDTDTKVVPEPTSAPIAVTPAPYTSELLQ